MEKQQAHKMLCPALKYNLNASILPKNFQMMEYL